MKETSHMSWALYVMPIPEVEEIIRRLFEEYLVEPRQSELLERMLSPSEVSKLFSPPVSVATISNWSTRGLLTKYRIGGRTYFKYGEVMEAIRTLKKYKGRIVYNTKHNI